MIEVGSIEQIFQITGRAGLTVVPGLKHEGLPESLKTGSEIIIVNPDGTELETTITGLEMVNTGKPMTHAPFSLPNDIKKESIQTGAKIYVRK